MPPRSVVVLAGKSETRSAVSAALQSDRSLAVQSACDDLHELVVHLRRTGAAAAVVDIDPNPQRMLAALDPVISRFSDTKFIVVSSAPAQDLLLEAMRVGARHVIPTGAIGAELVPVLHKLLPSNGHARSLALGAAISIIPAGGGAGATTLAVNLANELRLLTQAAALLVDLDCYYGAIPQFLGVDGPYSVADILATGERLDGEVVKSATIPFEDTLRILRSPAAGNVLAPDALALDQFSRFLSSCKEMYGFTVLDAPRLSATASARLANASSLVFVPFQLTVAGVRAARGVISALMDADCPGEHIAPVAMRYARRVGLIAPEEARKALAHPTMGLLYDDAAVVNESINLGRPLATIAPRSSLRKEIRRIAEHLHTAHSHGTTITSPWPASR